MPASMHVLRRQARHELRIPSEIIVDFGLKEIIVNIIFKFIFSEKIKEI